MDWSKITLRDMEVSIRTANIAEKEMPGVSMFDIRRILSSADADAHPLMKAVGHRGRKEIREVVAYLVQQDTKEAVEEGEIERRCTEIADQVVPEYRSGSYSCTGHTAKRWQAAWDGACVVLGGEPAEYRQNT